MNIDKTNLNPFTIDTIHNRSLILNMLKYEDSIIHSPIGKKIYNDDSYECFTTSNAMYTIHRIVLSDFNFSSLDSDVSNYKKIFSYYYKTPNDFDKEIIHSVTYMRENKCVYK
jgi:hypothetical protein